MKNIISLVWLRLRYFWKIIQLKVQFGKRISIKWSARISSTAIFRISTDSKIVVGDEVELRENVIIKAAAGGQIYIDEHVFMNDGCYLNSRDYIHIGSNTMFGQGVKIYDHDHDIRSEDMKTHFKQAPVEIGENVWICSDVIILRGCTVGSDSVVAAGTIVRKDVSSGVLCYTKKETAEIAIEKAFK